MNEEVRIALLEQNMKEVKDSLITIQADIKAMGKQVDNILTAKVMDHTTIRTEQKLQQRAIEDLQKKDGLWSWLSPTLSAIVASVLTFLLLSYFNHIK